MYSGKEFQTVGPATANAQRPWVLSLCCGTEIVSFCSAEVDFVAEGAFRLIDTGFRKFWWIFRPTHAITEMTNHSDNNAKSLFVLISCSHREECTARGRRAIKMPAGSA